MEAIAKEKYVNLKLKERCRFGRYSLFILKIAIFSRKVALEPQNVEWCGEGKDEMH